MELPPLGRPSRSPRLCIRGSVVVLSLVLLAEATAAQHSPFRGVLDVSAELSAGGALLEDHEVFFDDLGGLIFEDPLGAAVAGEGAVEVVALLEDASQTLFVLDTARRLGGVDVSPRDVVVFDGSGYSLAFDGGAAGIPVGARIDALARGVDGALLLSFDGFVEVDGFLAADEDLVRYDGAAFSLVFDGSAEGVPIALDLDAASVGGNRNLFVSFDGPGRIAGVDFFDEDVLEYDTTALAWVGALAIDVSAETTIDASVFAPGDLQAMHVPEPGFGGGLAIAVLGLSIRIARGRRCPHEGSHRRKRAGRRGALAALGALAVMAISGVASASDGVLEINQACAVTGGCFPGDAAGFPVEINATAGATSFRLTSDLEVPAFQTGIVVSGLNDVTVDLAGARIISQPCVGATSSTCAPASSGHGVFALAATDLTVRGGAIVGMGAAAILGGPRASIENVDARWHGSHGFDLSLASTVLGGTVSGTGSHGIVLGLYGHVEGTRIENASGHGIEASAGNSIIRSVTIEGSGFSGLSVTRTIVQDSTVSASGALGTSVAEQTGIACAESCVIERTLVFDSEDDGIRCTESCVVVGNRVEGAGDDGFECSRGCLIEGNVAYDVGDEALRSVSGGRIIGSTAILANGHGIAVGTSSSYQGNQIGSSTAYVTGTGDDLGGNVCDGNACP